MEPFVWTAPFSTTAAEKTIDIFTGERRTYEYGKSIGNQEFIGRGKLQFNERPSCGHGKWSEHAFVVSSRHLTVVNTVTDRTVFEVKRSLRNQPLYALCVLLFYRMKIKKKLGTHRIAPWTLLRSLEKTVGGITARVRRNRRPGRRDRVCDNDVGSLEITPGHDLNILRLLG